MITRFFIFMALVWSCYAQQPFTSQDTAWSGLFRTHAAWINYTNAILKDGPYLQWFFNTPNAVTDYAGTNTENWPAGWKTNQASIATVNQSSAWNSGVYNIPLANSNCLSQLDISTNPGTIEIYLQMSNNPVVANTPLFNKSVNNSPYDGEKYVVNQSSSVSYWKSPRFELHDASGNYVYVTGSVNLYNGMTYQLDAQWWYTNSQYKERLWVNGSPVESSSTTNGTLLVNMLSGTNIATFLGFPGYALSNNAIVGAFGYYTNVLSGDAILSHWLASQNQTFNPSNTMITCYPKVDQNGNPVQDMNAAQYVWCAASNLWYVYASPMNGIFTNYGSGPNITGRTNVFIYSTANLAANSYKYVGQAFPTIIPYDLISSCSVAQDTNTGNWVMWCFCTTTSTSARKFVVGYSTTGPTGPFAALYTNVMAAPFVNGGSPYLFEDPKTGVWWFYCTDYQSIQTNWICPMSSSLTNYYTSINGGLYTNFGICATAGGALETSTITYKNGYYYASTGSEEYFIMSKATNIFYQSATNIYGPWSALTPLVTVTNAAGAFGDALNFQQFSVIQSTNGVDQYLTGTSWNGVASGITDLSFSTAAMAKLYLNNGTAGLIVQKVFPLP